MNTKLTFCLLLETRTGRSSHVPFTLAELLEVGGGRSRGGLADGSAEAAPVRRLGQRGIFNKTLVHRRNLRCGPDHAAGAAPPCADRRREGTYRNDRRRIDCATGFHGASGLRGFTGLTSRGSRDGPGLSGVNGASGA